MKHALCVALTFLAGAAVTTFFWPQWYEMAPVIPLNERLTRTAMAFVPGIVVIAVGLDLLAGLPLVSWFFTWSDNLAIKGRPKSPAAAWREVRAKEQPWRWPLGARPIEAGRRRDRSGPCPCGRLTHRACIDSLAPEGGCLATRIRRYDEVHIDAPSGEEGPPPYHVRRVAPPRDTTLCPEARDALYRLFGRPPSDPSPPGLPRRDGVVLDQNASAALLRDVLGDDDC